MPSKKEKTLVAAPKAQASGVKDLVNSIVKDLQPTFEGVSLLGGSLYTMRKEDWISTGCRAINYAISGLSRCGIPIGRLTEIFGDFSSGKTLLLGHILAEVQKLGGIAILIDTEVAFSKVMARNIGIDINQLIYFPAETIEEVFLIICDIIALVREKAGDRYIVIGLDSVAATPTKKELEEDVGKAEMAGRARLMSKGLRKIMALISKQKVGLVFTNQIRDKLGVMYGPKFTTSGGRAVPFHSSVRIHMKRGKKIVSDVLDRVIGMEGTLEVVKNKLFPPFRKASFRVFFDRGIPEFEDYLSVLEGKGLVVPNSEKKKTWWQVVSDGPDGVRFRPSELEELLKKRPELLEID